MYLQIVLATGLRQEFTYLATEETKASYTPKIGLRVRVNFGRSERVGLIVGVNKTTDVDFKKLKPIIQVLDEARHYCPQISMGTRAVGGRLLPITRSVTR